MSNLADYNAWKEKRQQADAGAANVVIGQDFADQPDAVATDLNLGQEFAKSTGNPVPPLSMTKEFRPAFQKAVDQAKAKTVLSSSPMLAEWLRRPDNAAVARDDLAGLSWWETVGGAAANAVQRGAMRLPQSFDQFVAEGFAKRSADAKLGFGEILDDEMTQGMGKKLIPGPDDLFWAGSRFITSQLDTMFGNDIAAKAAFHQQRAGEIAAQIQAIPMSPVADAFRKSLYAPDPAAEAYALGVGTVEPADDLSAQFGSFVNKVAADPGGALAFITETAVESAPTLAASTAVTIATRNPTAGAVFMGGVSGLQERFLAPAELFAEKGIDISTPEGAMQVISDPALMAEAAERGELRGVIIGLMDGLSGGIAGQTLAKSPIGNVLLQAIVQASMGGFGEAAAQIAAGQKFDLNEVIIEALAEFVTAPLEVAGVGGGMFVERQAKAKDAESRKTLFEALSGQAVASKLRERMPDRFRQFVEQATANGPVENVYVPSAAWVTYFQSQGVDPFEIAATIDGVSADDLETALATGGDLKIPTASYATVMAGSPHDAFLMENMRFSPDDYTSVEAAEFNARAADAMEEAYALADQLRRDDEELRSVETELYDTMVSRLREAGRSTDVATAEAMLYPAFYRTMAERSGMTIDAFVAKYPLPQVRAAVPAGLQLRDADALTRTLSEARAQKTAGISRGQSLLEFISERGGIDDRGGELKARDAEVIKRGRGKKTLRLARKGLMAGMRDMLGGDAIGHGFDDVARSAIEAGFMAADPVAMAYKEAQRNGTEVPDIGKALLDAMDREIRGAPEYADGVVATPVDGLDTIEEYLAGLGLSLADDDAAIAAALAADQTDGGKSYGQADGSGFGTGAGLGGPRGAIQFSGAGIGKGETIISLFAGADLSTFVHESGHYFLTVMRDMAATDPAGAIAADFQAVNDWWHSNADAVAKDATAVADGVQITADDVRLALDAGTTGDAAKDAAIDVGMQEQFARATEQYLMDGKAPSIGLRAAFEKFRAWLVSVYRRALGLNVEISDEMRAVFDRMLATDDEIAKAKTDAAITAPLFASAEEMGLSEKDYAAFVKLYGQAQDEANAKLLGEIMAPVRRAATEAFKAERKAVHAEMTKTVRAMRMYRAIQEMRFAKSFDGDEVPAVKLDRAAIEKDFGAGWLAQLPGATKDGNGHRNAVFANEGGLHPDIVAGMYGYGTGAELLDALAKAPPIAEAIEAETDKVMKERHNDPLTDGSVQQAALDAVHGDKRGEVLALELKALNAVAGLDRELSHKDARESARRTLRTMKVRDAVRADRFLAAERHAGEDAQRLAGTVVREGLWMDAARRRVAVTARGATREGNASAALGINAKVDAANKNTGRRNERAAELVEAKRRQLLNHMLYAESRKVDVGVDRLVSQLHKLNKSDEKLSKARNIDYVKAARAIAARFGLARAERAFDFSAWVDQLRFDDPVVADALTHAIAVNTNDARLYKDLTVSELDAVKDAIESILEVGKRSRLLEIDGQAVERELAISELRDVLDTRTKGENAALSSKLTKLQKYKVGALSILSSLRRMETWSRDMDDGKAGVFTRYLVKPIMDAVGVYRLDKATRLQALLDILNPRRGDLLGAAIPAPELGYTFENKGELLHAILHTGNESNLEKLLMGRGWSTGLTGQAQRMTPSGKPSVDREGNPLMTRGRVDTSKWDAFIARQVAANVITKADYDTAQQIWDLMNEIKKPAQSAHRRVYGYYFQEVEPSAVLTAFGTYRGGYVPAIADNDASNDGQIRADQAALEAQQTSFMFPTTGSGFTKSRVQNYTTPLSLNLMLLPAHMDKVLRFTHLNPVIRQTASLVTSGELRGAIDAVDKSIIPNLITPWLQRTAQQAVEAQPTTPAGRAASTFFRTMRKRVGIHTMFANMVNTAQQITGLSSAMVLVKPARMKAALVRFTTGGGAAMRSEAMEASALMRDRITNAGREIQGRIQDAIVKPTALSGVDGFITKHGYFAQQAAQNLVDVIAWHAAHDQAMAGGMDSEAAVFEADSVIRRTMGDFSPENLSMFETGSAFVRLFTMFFSYFNGQANLVGGEMQTVIRTMGWNGKSRMFFIYLFGMAIPAMVGEMIVLAARGEMGDDDEEDGYLDEIAEFFFGSHLRYAAAAVPIAGPLTTAALNRFNSLFYDDRLSTSPVLSAAERAISAPASIFDAATGNGTARKATIDGITALGLILGIPTGQLAKMAGYAVGVVEGYSDPENPLDVAKGLVSGRDGTE